MWMRWRASAVLWKSSPETEALLRARVLAIQADANWKMGSRAEAIDQYSRAFQFDPGVFRRLELRLPVSLQSVGSGDVLEDSVDAIENSPRFEVHAGSPFVVRVEQADKLRVCLLAPDDSILACAEQEVSRDEGAGSIVERLMIAFHEVAFMPRIDMSQSDVEGLDGSNQVGPNPLGDFLDLDDGP